jgi:hypothetical protein
MQRARIAAMFSFSTRRPADSSSAATRKTDQTAEDNAEPEGTANTNTGTGFARAKICRPPRRLQPPVAHGREKENPRQLRAVAPGQGRNIGVTVLAPSRRTQPKTISLVASSRGSIASTVAARKQEVGVFAVPCLGASVA